MARLLPRETGVVAHSTLSGHQPRETMPLRETAVTHSTPLARPPWAVAVLLPVPRAMAEGGRVCR